MAIKVLIVDDSAIVRQILGDYIRKDPELELIAVAPDPIFAMEKMRNQLPDVIVLDIEMPRMDGISFLRKIMKESPTPVVICSTLAEENSETTFIALEEGAVEIITKPKVGLKGFLEESFIQITDAIKSAASANMKVARRNVSEKISSSNLQNKQAITSFKESGLSAISATEKIVAIGTSTGGTIALEQVLSKCDKAKTPGILIVQHMPEMFTKSFAKRLNDICEIEVREAVDGERVLPGHALIAPGNRHMQVKRSGAQYVAVVSDGPLVNRHRPSVDVLFRSVAKEAGKNARGIIMTGMGDDGAAGLLEMRRMGAFTIAQNEETSVVFGMPKEAIRKGAVDKIVALENIYREIMDQRF
ncbi:MAG: chemotaxis response regulator protein-glutamate methylesterase [Leptospira sp.]|jgi:two-component system chemotaxis response regulator CheB|nr:MAG: chemotaxis response regulator protein-glutamate methylesterase [Leptospira sp.]